MRLSARMTLFLLVVCALAVSAAPSPPPIQWREVSTLLSPQAVKRSEAIRPQSFRVPLRLSKRAKSSTGVRDERLLSRKESDRATNATALEDLGMDTFYSAVWQVGTPAVDVHVLMDTGSSAPVIYAPEFMKGLNASYAQEASESGDASTLPPAELLQGNATYDWNNSTSSHAVTLQNGTTNLQGSVAYGSGADVGYGVYLQDTVEIAGFKIEQQPFLYLTQGTITQAGKNLGGLFGLGWSAMGATGDYPFINPLEYLWRSGALEEPLFTFALLRNVGGEDLSDGHEGAASDNPGGLFTIGSLDRTQYDGEIAWAPLVTSDAYPAPMPKELVGKPNGWFAQIDYLKVNGKIIETSRKLPAHFDTGGIDMSMPPWITDDMFSKVKGARYQEELGYTTFPCSLPGAGPATLNLTLAFGGQEFHIDMEDLVSARMHDSKGKVVCRRNSASNVDASADGPVQPLLFGASVLKNVFAAFRFEPPSIGLAHLSGSVKSREAPKDDDPNFSEAPPGATPNADAPHVQPGPTIVKPEDYPWTIVTQTASKQVVDWPAATLPNTAQQRLAAVPTGALPVAHGKLASSRLKAAKFGLYDSLTSAAAAAQTHRPGQSWNMDFGKWGSPRQDWMDTHHFNDDDEPSRDISLAARIGIIVGAALLGAIVIGLCALICKRRRKVTRAPPMGHDGALRGNAQATTPGVFQRSTYSVLSREKNDAESRYDAEEARQEMASQHSEYAQKYDQPNYAHVQQTSEPDFQKHGWTQHGGEPAAFHS
ncbi:Aspartyl protease [Ceraceosorus bombacis]|uniref:Aspartyl protease n=1 Tax=Ceraceosorus bombacis TaxID=401625 RepID=A0A0P1BGY4_9BASI|nr:Aspartyl protease [Ceraceosorus bombacis]